MSPHLRIVMPLASIIFFLLPNLNLVAIVVTAQQDNYRCLENGNYTTNSTYETNLHNLLSTLATNIDRNGFYNASIGETPDVASAMALCRGDVGLAACRKCVGDAIANLTGLCPYRKQALIWYSDDNCMVRYSDEPIFGLLDNSPMFRAPNSMDASNPNQFRNDLRNLLDELRSRAINGGDGRKVGAGSLTGADSRTIFALVQCSPDLVREDCDDCLSGCAAEIPTCCDRADGARIFNPSCIVRYQSNSFFNETILQEFAPVYHVNRPDLSPARNDEANRTRNIVIIVVTITVSVMAIVIVGILLRRRRNQIASGLLHSVDNINAAESLQYAFSTIRAATDNFSDNNKLGQGGFGAVYKGVLPSGQEIAVKRLGNDSSQGDIEFKNEVLLLASLQHKNLVRLLGFSMERTEKLLVYEFVANGSLDHFIFVSDPINHSILDWDRRFKIIQGIARGLMYLHEDSRLKIIHRDLKASNVLLDGEMAPKIADFGLAKLFGQNETQGNTSRVVGTYGYMPPEYIMHGQISVKCDVFSFGVLILEIISGKRSNQTINEESTVDLLNFAWKSWCDGTSDNIVDSYLKLDPDCMSEILRCIHIGLLCVQQDPAARPTMGSIVIMLGSLTATLAVPTEPAFHFGSDMGTVTWTLKGENSSKGYIPAQFDESSSKNSISITELHPR